MWLVATMLDSAAQELGVCRIQMEKTKDLWGVSTLNNYPVSTFNSIPSKDRC